MRTFLTARIAECDESIFNAGEIAADGTPTCWAESANNA